MIHLRKTSRRTKEVPGKVLSVWFDDFSERMGGDERLSNSQFAISWAWKGCFDMIYRSGLHSSIEASLCAAQTRFYNCIEVSNVSGSAPSV